VISASDRDGLSKEHIVHASRYLYYYNEVIMSRQNIIMLIVEIVNANKSNSVLGYLVDNAIKSAWQL
jgi:hypothetical protein